MFSPHRSRKPSISDIIDVLNIKDEKLPLWDTKDSLSSKKTSDFKLSPLDCKLQPVDTKASLPINCKESLFDISDSYLDSKSDDVDSGYSESPGGESTSNSDCCSSSEEYSPASWHCSPTSPSKSLFLSSHPTKEHQGFFENENTSLDVVAGKLNELYNRKKENELWLSSLKKGNGLSLLSNESEDQLLNHNKEDNVPLTDVCNSTTSEMPMDSLRNDQGKNLNEENLLKLATESVNKRKLSIEAASCLLSTKEDAIIIVLEEDETVKYMSTSRQKLQNFLVTQPQDKNNNITNNSMCHTEFSPINSSSERVDDTLNASEQMKRRGRKRVHEPDKTEEERGEKKRERNNEACRKFRKSRKVNQKVLFKQESALLQHNLNLKEQIAALDRQLLYIKEKLGMSAHK